MVIKVVSPAVELPTFLTYQRAWGGAGCSLWRWLPSAVAPFIPSCQGSGRSPHAYAASNHVKAK